MSNEPSKKRKKSGDDEEEVMEDATLKAAIGAYKNADLDVFYGAKAFVTATKKDDHEIFRVLNGTYIEDVDNLGSFVTPLYLRTFETVRDPGTSRITCIHDDKSKVEGTMLSRVLALSNLKAQGYDVIIFDKKESDSKSCFALKSQWQLDEDATTKRKQHHESVHKLYGERGFTRVYVTRELLVKVLSHSFVPLSKIRTLASKLNNLVEKQECTLDLDKFNKLKNVVEARDSGQKRAESDFLEELIAAHVTKATWKSKVNTFKSSPSPSLARRLQLLKPYQGRLIDRTTNREAKQVELKDLEDDGEVLLSTVSIDTKFYNTVVGDVKTWKVYQPSPNLGINKDKKGWVQLEGQAFMTKRYFLAMLTAIAESNSSDKKPAAVEPADADALNKLQADVDI